MAEEQHPWLNVRLEVDAQGKPEVIRTGKLQHYKVIFEVENAPPDTYAATFELDPTYYDPLRTLQPDDKGGFRLETTTYGDYPLIVRLHRPKTGDLVIKESVARALRRARKTMPAGPEIDDALAYIADH